MLALEDRTERPVDLCRFVCCPLWLCIVSTLSLAEQNGRWASVTSSVGPPWAAWRQRLASENRTAGGPLSLRLLSSMALHGVNVQPLRTERPVSLCRFVCWSSMALHGVNAQPLRTERLSVLCRFDCQQIKTYPDTVLRRGI